MTLKNTKILTGLLVFIIALTVYLLTLEPTNSLWDCSEFITCAYGLQVGHAPGAPVFMILGRLFGLLANEPENVAQMINGLSAVSSALTVMILFFTIYWFAEQFLKSDSRVVQKGNNLIVIASSFIGAITYAFTDSFWFSAVEAEVYATSSLFTALVFWAVLQYSKAPKNQSSYKWIILIFFILGLSVGIHLLNLLTLPAMALVVYFKHCKPTVKGVLITLVFSISLIVFLIYGIIPGVVKMAAFTDRIFVNSFSLPLYSGAILFIAILSSALYFLFQYYLKKQKVIQQVIVLSFTFWLIGYSSFTILVIRSAQNPFVDINNVENIYGLVDYLNREQYPSRPLFYGNSYNSPIVEVKKRFTYKYHNGIYFKDELNPKYIYNDKTLTLFPRMASVDKQHVAAYKSWVNIKGKPVKILNRSGEQETIYVPTFKENIKFFFKYQLGYMYGRYLMWNFVGKQNDIQGKGDALHGNWLSGISYLDNVRLGNQENMPVFYKNHKSRNTYYFLPFLLGIVGMLYQYKRDKNNFWVNIALFFFTGLAIVLYLNEVPITPRERDYIHVGSFYVFALWIGLGAFGILNFIKKCFISKKCLTTKNPDRLLKIQIPTIVTVAFLLLLAVPINMLFENWDDHDRSNRYTANAYGKNMLNSCEQNAILFTTADNDTYPLWYLQEVEKYRPDIRNVLLTFLPVDWYAGQLHQQSGEKGKIAISFKGKELLMSKNQYFPIINKIDSFIDVNQVIDFVKSTDRKTQIRTADNSLVNFIPGNKFELKVNSDNFLKSCSYLQSTGIEIPSSIKFTINKSYLGRDNLLILDILANNNWERPLYFIYPHLLKELGLDKYLHREGMVYRFLPFTQNQIAAFAKEQSLYQYKMIKNDFSWGNVGDADVYLDYTNVQIAGSFRIRQMFIETANLLITCDEKVKAAEILDIAQKVLPPEKVPYSWFIPEMVKAYKMAGYNDKANELSEKIENEMAQRYLFNRELKKQGRSSLINHETLYIMQYLADIKN